MYGNIFQISQGAVISATVSVRGKTGLWEEGMYWTDVAENRYVKMSFVALGEKSGGHHHCQVCVFFSNNLLGLFQFTWDLFYSGAWIYTWLANNRQFLLFVCAVFNSFPACLNTLCLIFLFSIRAFNLIGLPPDYFIIHFSRFFFWIILVPPFVWD